MKVKINNIDEFCEALKSGYTITDKNGVHIVFLGKSINLYGIGFAFDFPDMYYEKPSPLKIECGKYYETKHNIKAIIGFKEDDYFIGIVEEKPVLSVKTWTEEGRCHQGPEYGLISEWKEDK